MEAAGDHAWAAGSAWTQLHVIGLTGQSPHPWVEGYVQAWGKARSAFPLWHHVVVVRSLAFVSKANEGGQPPKLANKILAPPDAMLFISLR